MTLLLILYLVLAGSFTTAKVVLNYMSPLFFCGTRMIISGLLLLGYLYFFKKEKISIKKADAGIFFRVILFHIFFAFVFDLITLQYMSSSRSALLYNTTPFFSALFSYFYFSEVMTWKKLLGLVIGFIGLLPIIMGENCLSCVATIFGIPWPDILLMLGIVSASYGWILVRQLVRDRGYSTPMVNGTAMVGGGILALISSFLFETTKIMITSQTDLVTLVSNFILIIILANIVFYNLYGYLLHYYSATFLSFVGFITPLFVAFFGWLWLDESMGWTFAFSLLIVSVGLYIFYQEELRQGYIARDENK